MAAILLRFFWRSMIVDYFFLKKKPVFSFSFFL